MRGDTTHLNANAVRVGNGQLLWAIHATIPRAGSIVLVHRSKGARNGPANVKADVCISGIAVTAAGWAGPPRGLACGDARRVLAGKVLLPRALAQGFEVPRVL